MRKILENEHIYALISDSFWYIICIFFKDGSPKYAAKREQLLDRIAANFVSFFIDYKSSKEQFIFTYFFDIMAQAVFFSLFFAYPKSRVKFDINLIFKLLQEFSELYNGPKIRHFSLELFKHWSLDLGTGNIIENLRQNKSSVIQEPEVRQHARSTTMQTMRYSQLVERYLKTHKYECFNVIKPWKCRVNDKTEVHRRESQQFSGFVQTAKKILAKNHDANKELNAKIEKEKKELNHTIKECNDHILRLEQHEKDILDERLPEYANYLVSMFNKDLDNIKAITNSQ
eukprot:TRINITY_DN8216_c0_g1_i6.p1 TRINITY_DN8216_c0_g1~~TRINITY_DN8216_c0_g1_i6.p1  ORF type:complete len:286 (-),score=89.20 TRINITY_DN8216_c0_g1_i6:161-1018(-)